ncbi:MAG: vWA domain-containing protein, partial [Thermodesulfobacteriota bacterium]|nr:vWA domain-containing protein [Thermodesulfobacteriota bacterium]
MTFIENVKPILRRISPFYLFLIAISPFLMSFLIHMMVLFYASTVTWLWVGKVPVIEKEIPVHILNEGKKDTGLTFQGKDLLNDFDAEDSMFDPVPEIEYRPVIPDLEILPDPKARDEFDIISIEATATDSEWPNPTTGGQPLDTGSEMQVGSFSRHIQILREGGLDVVFVFDSTSSMGTYLKAVKSKIKNLTSAFRKLVPICRIGMVTYRDYQDVYVVKQHTLTHGILSLEAFLSEIDAGGGYDIREAVAEGLNVAINGMNWNKKSKKIILLIGDAPPHTKDMHNAVELVKKFRDEMGGKLSVIDVRRPQNMTEYY